MQDMLSIECVIKWHDFIILDHEVLWKWLLSGLLTECVIVNETAIMCEVMKVCDSILNKYFV